MANITVPFSAPTASTAKALPFPGGSLADYVASGVAATEADSPDLGRFSITLDDAVATVWRVFLGAGQPASWDDYELEIDLLGDVLTAANFSDSALAKINQHRRS